MHPPLIIVWFRQDLRLHDNPALYEAAQKGSILPIYILDDHHAQQDKMGAASRFWLHHSLLALDKSLDYQLSFYQGNAQTILLDLIQRYPIQSIYWNRCYEPWQIKRDQEIKKTLKEKGIECLSFSSALLWEPWENLKKDSTPYQVFTPFYQHYLKNISPRIPKTQIKKLSLIKDTKNPTKLDDLPLLPTIPWDKKLQSHWQIGETGAQTQLHHFIENGLAHYQEGRDFPAQDAVSHLSPHLHFGEISPHQVWYAIQMQSVMGKKEKEAAHFLRQLIWREFSYYLLYYHPTLPYQNLQAKFDHFSWEKDTSHLKAWQRGQTGIPFIDAGMRELWQTGYMHNRLRMITGSFLVKNLRLHWHHGARWFWDCLVDADLANNSASWQWVAGCGVDAAPYFRIFNPITQGEKFDPKGEYTRRFVPELVHLPDKYLFRPWEAPSEILQKAGVNLGENYPYPIVSLSDSREKALQAFASLKEKLI